jgi:nitrogen fixation NifU-like protein
MITEMAKSKRISDALAIDQKAVLEALEGLPEDSIHCAQLAANTLKEAIRDYLACQREPWRKNYRKPSLSD